VPGSLPPLSEIWELAQGNLRHFPEEYRHILSAKPYPVHFSESVRKLRDAAKADEHKSLEPEVAL
jgi:hypothetical protein